MGGGLGRRRFAPFQCLPLYGFPDGQGSSLPNHWTPIDPTLGEFVMKDDVA